MTLARCTAIRSRVEPAATLGAPSLGITAARAIVRFLYILNGNDELITLQAGASHSHAILPPSSYQG
jgi:hypothetical protein